jgi:hypothetical protein
MDCYLVLGRSSQPPTACTGSSCPLRVTQTASASWPSLTFGCESKLKTPWNPSFWLVRPS